MATLRALFSSSPRLFLALMLVALGAKLLVPAGYMVMPAQPGAMSFSVGVCNATGPSRLTVTIPMDQPQPSDERAAADKPCAFAGLGQPMLPGTDPVQLALAIAFIIALGFAALPVLRRAASPRVLPPSQAPPILN
ncbi:hypothetical protein ACPVPU_00700 [Sphingomonas sp. CJ99]